MKISTSMAKRHITNFENAVVEYAFKGSKHPDDWDTIDERYNKAKKTLTQFCIEAVIGPEPKGISYTGCEHCGHPMMNCVC